MPQIHRVSMTRYKRNPSFIAVNNKPIGWQGVKYSLTVKLMRNEMYLRLLMRKLIRMFMHLCCRFIV